MWFGSTWRVVCDFGTGTTQSPAPRAGLGDSRHTWFPLSKAGHSSPGPLGASGSPWVRLFGHHNWEWSVLLASSRSRPGMLLNRSLPVHRLAGTTDQNPIQSVSGAEVGKAWPPVTCWFA